MFVDAFYSTIGVVIAFAIICCIVFVYKWIKAFLSKKWNNIQEDKNKKNKEKSNVASEEDLYNDLYNIDGK